jgi:hypothetical protein
MGVRSCGRGSPAVGDDDRRAERIDRATGRAGHGASDVCADGTARHGHTGSLHTDSRAANDDSAYRGHSTNCDRTATHDHPEHPATDDDLAGPDSAVRLLPAGADRRHAIDRRPAFDLGFRRLSEHHVERGDAREPGRFDRDLGRPRGPNDVGCDHPTGLGARQHDLDGQRLPGWRRHRGRPPG